MSESQMGNTNRRTPIICVELGREFESIDSAEKEFKCYRGTIGRAVRGERKTALGYHWIYKQ